MFIFTSVFEFKHKLLKMLAMSAWTVNSASSESTLTSATSLEFIIGSQLVDIFVYRSLFI